MPRLISKWTPALIASFRADWLAGMSEWDMSERYGIAGSSIRTKAMELGLPGRKNKTKPSPDHDDARPVETGDHVNTLVVGRAVTAHWRRVRCMACSWTGEREQSLLDDGSAECGPCGSARRQRRACTVADARAWA